MIRPILVGTALALACVLATTVAPPNAESGPAFAVANQAVPPGPVLQYEHGGLLTGFASDGNWTYVIQGGRVHALDAAQTPAALDATSAPVDVALDVIAAADGVVAVAGTSLFTYRHEQGALTLLGEQPLLGTQPLRTEIGTIEVHAGYVWMTDSESTLRISRLDGDGAPGPAFTWSPPANRADDFARVFAMFPVRGTKRLVLGIHWLSSDFEVDDAIEYFEIESGPDGPSLVARFGLNDVGWSGALLADGSDVLLADLSGERSAVKAWHYRRQPGELREVAALRWDGVGTAALAWIDGRLWRLDLEGTLYVHDGLVTEASRVVATNTPFTWRLGRMGTRPAILRDRKLERIDAAGKLLVESAIDATEYIRIAHTDHGAWLYSEAGERSHITVEDAVTRGVGPLVVDDTPIGDMLGYGEFLATIQEDRIVIERDEGNGQRSLEASWQPHETVAETRLVAANADRLVYASINGSTWVQESAGQDDRPAPRRLHNAEFVWDGHLHGPRLHLLSAASGLLSFDLEPLVPRALAAQRLAGAAPGRHAFRDGGAVLGQGANVSSVDLRDPANVMEVDRLDLPETVSFLARANGTVWVRWAGPADSGVTALAIDIQGYLTEIGSRATGRDFNQAPIVADADGAWLLDASGALRRYGLERGVEPSQTQRPPPTAGPTLTARATATEPATPTPVGTPGNPRRPTVYLPWVASLFVAR